MSALPQPSNRPASRSRWPAWLRAGTAAETDLLFPPRCTFCEGPCESREGQPMWCETCEQKLTLSRQPSCPRCAGPCPEADALAGPCPNCRGLKLSYAEARALGLYDGLLRQAVLKIKHSYHEPLAADLGRRLADRIRRRPFADPPKLVAPVPMFWVQRLWRGTNAAQVLAQAVARELGLPLASHLLVCRRWLRKQSTLKTDERRRNVRGAFRASWRYHIKDARILLVDDVMTTGATAQEAARALRVAGAGAVFVAAVARSTHQP